MSAWIPVDVLVPVKPLALAKSRLLGAADAGRRDRRAHARLALAIARDTIAAARAAARVRTVLAVCSDPVASATLRTDGVTVVTDEPDAGLNAALVHGARVLDTGYRAGRERAAVGALNADLPALRPAELDAALAAAEAAFTHGVRAVFCRDHQNTGTTLLIAAPAATFDPRFGPDSAAAHAADGTLELTGDWPSLRCDVDTVADLRRAGEIGLGPRTRAVLSRVRIA